MKIKKVLVLGSGALKIGEAGEFDYSGSQAIKALKEEGIKTVLVNPNIATIQTSEFLADIIYFLPVNADFVAKVIEKEKPDSILLSFGGQTALNCGIELEKKGILKKYNINVLGNPIDSIILSEDRELFANHLRSLDISTPDSRAAETVHKATEIARHIGYPVMVRAAFALGGQKSGVVHNEIELLKKLEGVFSFSSQVLIEKYLHHYKEIEYEIVRDQFDNCVAVCNMENMDPLGIHTGESVVVAPSQTLTNYEYHQLRKTAIKIARSLKIVGECNVQFALNPKPKGQEMEYYVIELNARLSRSSALASKATGYPLAYVAAKLALGQSLTEIKNQVTQVTQSCFEPALDYIVVKIPRWDLEKFKGADRQIGSSMKSVGEVMGIGRTFEEAFQKAIRMLDRDLEGITDYNFSKVKDSYLKYITTPNPKRMFALAEGLKKGMSTIELYNITGIDPWFLYRIKNILEGQKKAKISKNLYNRSLLLSLKKLGFSDKQIGSWVKKTGLEIRKLRKKLHINPYVFQIDTLAGEFPAPTNYLYMTYHGTHHDVLPLQKKAIIVLGSGPYHIGSSVEFDWTCVNTVLELKNHNKKSIVINCNPETVSTDYDISDRLYFEELTFERIADIYEFENPDSVIVSVGGQRPNTLAFSLSSYGFTIRGTQAVDIDRAEDRNKFSKILDELNIPQPLWNKFTTIEDALLFAKKVEYPVLVRPSYVLSGSAMNVCYTDENLIDFVKQATHLNKDNPITVSKFMTNAKEIELDAIAQNGEVQVYCVAEHVEAAGVHSGDASIVYPPQRLYLHTEKRIIEIGQQLAAAFHVTGPFNIQFIAKDNKVYVIEANLRASRTLPFISKATKTNFVNVLVDSLFGKSKKIQLTYPNYIAVKVPQFSFSRLEGADPILRVEMSSTGEAASFGNTIEEAFLKAELSVGARIPKKGIFVSLGGEENKVRFLKSAFRLRDFGLPIFATEKTARFLTLNGIPTKRLHKLYENKKPNFLTYFQGGKIDLVINIVVPQIKKDMADGYVIRRTTIDHNIQLFTDRNKADLFIKALTEYKIEDLEVKAWHEYI